MGNHAKTQRLKQDRFYRLAKETGYRSRASFKLIQLNRKFGFLNEARVVVDLCAAPGGWLQVVDKILPVSSLIIGVDLSPIKPIRNVITLVNDITTDGCLKEIQTKLQTWKADVVLHDGAPNLGKGWIVDAFGQAQLTLSAIRLMSKILKTHGCFVTKVFRSQEYLSIIKILKMIFKHIHSTKPIASRNESAEIFVVCQDFIGINKFDNSILSFKNVFQQSETLKTPMTLKKLINEQKPNQKGYPDNAPSLIYQKRPVSEFLNCDSPLEFLATSNEFILDDQRFDKESLTSSLIKEYIKDVRVLGFMELKALLSWRKRLIRIFKLDKSDENDGSKEKEDEDQQKEETEEQEIERVAKEEYIESKRENKKQKKLERKQKKLSKKASSQISLGPELTDDNKIFSLSSLKNISHLNNLLKYEKSFQELSNDYDEEKVEHDVKPTELEKKLEKTRSKIADKQSPFVVIDAPVLLDDFEDDKVVEADVDFLLGNKRKRLKTEKSLQLEKFDDKQVKPKILSPEELAIGQYIKEDPAHKKKLLEESWNRYMRDGDEKLPSFFKEYEENHLIRTLPITKEQVEFYQKKEFELNSKPTKKVLEAKARKFKKYQKVVEKTTNKAEKLLFEEGIVDCDKIDQVKKLYKKANKTLHSRPKTKLIVSKKGLASQGKGRNSSKGKGPVKIVDRRMKKDKRNEEFIKKRKHRSKSRMRKRR